MPGDIRNLEIFGAGTHNGVKVTEDDLDQIVSAFTELQGSNIVKPHLKLGHTDAQKWFGQDKGIPTLGWITKVWRNGKKLLADVANVPDALLQMFRDGRYHNVSAEVYWDAPIEHAGKKFARVLSAVAILGTEMPAVKDLAGIAAALFAEQFSGSVDASPVVFSIEHQPQRIPGMFTQEQLDSLIAAAVTKATKEFEAKLAAATDDLKTQVTVLTTRAEAAEGKLVKMAEDNAQAETTRLVDDAIKAGKLLPKQKEFALAFLKNAKGVIKFGDKEVGAAKLFSDFLEAGGKQVALGARSEGGEANGAFSSAAQEVDTKAKQLQASDAKLDYRAAMAKVFEADPQLKDRYVNGE